MSMIFKFRMLSDENDHFLRDYEVPYDMNLLELHRFLCDNLGYDEQNMASFFSSDKQWNKLQEYTLLDMGDDGSDLAPRPMESVTLGQIIHKNNDRLIYVFDPFGDRALYLELTASTKEEPHIKYPRLVKAEAEAPNQFEADMTSQESGSMFDEAMGEFSDFEGDDTYDDEY